MTEQNCCGTVKGRTNEYETARIEKTANVCPMCETYAQKNSEKPIAVMSCEGACLRGEVSRRAANLLCHFIAPAKTARICLGGAFTKDTGQRNLVKKASKVLALEGCFIQCSSRMMAGVIAELEAEIIIVDELYEFDRALFGIDEVPDPQISAYAWEAARQIAQRL